MTESASSSATMTSPSDIGCKCPPCPGRGNDGHGMTHCAECCFGTHVEAEPDCPVHGVVVVQCRYDPPHTHVYPHDWQFGGANGTHPGSDPRWRPSVYVYISSRLEVIHTTVAPLCDDEAIDRFTDHRYLDPKWIRVRRPDGTSETLPVIYDPETDEVFDQ